MAGVRRRLGRWTQRRHEPPDDSLEPVPLLTPEERILRLLEEHDGWMRQHEIAAAVEWSKSTVSRRLTKLESSGAVDRYRLGREKLVVVPGAELDGFRSPFERRRGDVSVDGDGAEDPSHALS